MPAPGWLRLASLSSLRNKISKSAWDCSSGDTATDEVVGEHRAVEQISDRVHDAFDRDVAAKASVGDQPFVDMSPLLAVSVAIFEIRRAAATFEVRTLLDQQLDVFRMVLKEFQVGANAASDALDRVPLLVGGLRHGCLHLTHAGVDTGVEELFLAREIQIQRPLGDAQFGRHAFHLARRITQLGELVRRGLDDRSAPLFTPIRRASFGCMG